MADGTVVLNQSLLAKTFVNVLVFSNMPEGEQEFQTVADNIRGFFAASDYLDFLSQEWRLNSITLAFNSDFPSFSVEVPFTSGPLAGTSSGDPLSTRTALLASTSLIGVPPNRGRIYLGGLTEAGNDNTGKFNATVRGHAQELIEEFALEGVPTGSNSMFLRIGRRDNAGTIIASNPVQSVVMRANPATIMNRRQGSN